VNIELCTDALLQALLAPMDPGRAGAFVEVGLGGGNFSFEWAAPAGFRCYAVEPLPTDALIAACQRSGVVLHRAAIGDQCGEVLIFLGELDGHRLPDISSLNPRWWGVGATSQSVRAQTLVAAVAELGITTIGCLKIDTEGSERAIISGLRALGPKQRPGIVTFEYGGGGTKATGAGGWAPEFLDNTRYCVGELQALGYQGGFVIERRLAGARFFEFAALPADADPFPAESEVGNLLLMQAPPSRADAEVILRRVAPLLEKDARRAAARARRDWFKHQYIRLRAGVRRRLGRKESQP
jgi:FkbM family methyltransferase